MDTTAPHKGQGSSRRPEDDADPQTVHEHPAEVGGTGLPGEDGREGVADALWAIHAELVHANLARESWARQIFELLAAAKEEA
jgi:hypothetical protein